MFELRRLASACRLSLLTASALLCLPWIAMGQEPGNETPATGAAGDPATLTETLTETLSESLPAPAEEDATAASEATSDAPDLTAGSWPERVAALGAAIKKFEANESDADALFYGLGEVLHERIHRANDSLEIARSPHEPVARHASIPPDIVTLEALKKNVDALYNARLELLEHLSDELRLEVTATDVIGVDQLTMESEYIWLQLKYRALDLPETYEKVLRRVQIAPIPLIWSVIQFLLVIAVFRWWRRWFPETLRRMQVSLAEIRPRSAAVMRRIRFIWYVEQLRRPIEWLLLTSILFSMLHVEGLNLLLSIIETIVRWILLGWLAVSILNAFSARGAAGLTGIDAELRLKSLQLIAGWLVLLGLGLDLANDLAGEATLYAWVWRLFQVLALPVLLILLAWWRKPIFTRLEREAENSESVQAILSHRTGLRSFTSAAQGGLWLLANNLRRSLMRVFLKVGDVQSLGFSTSTAADTAEPELEQRPGISAAAREVLLSGEAGFEKHARSDRRRLARSALAHQPGIVAIVGERGIGKTAFLADLQASLGERALFVDSSNGCCAELETAVSEQLSLAASDPEQISAAMADQDIRAVLVRNVHRLSRPVLGGQTELRAFTDFIEAIDHKVLWILTIDCFAWQFMRRVRADQASIHEIIDIPDWPEEAMVQLLDQRTEEAGLSPDFSRVQVPDEHAVTSYDSAEERNRAGVYRMLWTLSGGNPAIALHAWANCLYYDDEDRLFVRLPSQPPSHELDDAAHNVLLVLRCIAQADQILEADVVDNLRLPAGAVDTAMHFCSSRGWIEAVNGRFRITMPWFRTITRTLARQNLLAR